MGMSVIRTPVMSSTALAIAGAAQIEIWNDELERAGASYWIDTIKRARSLLAHEASLRFLIGADQAVAFDRWRCAREILSLATPIVMLRSPIDTLAGLLAQLRDTNAWSDGELALWESWVWQGSMASASSTASREQLARGESVNDLHPDVRTYIEQHGLYPDRAGLRRGQ